MAEVFTLTPAAAAQALRNNGLDALGLTALRLWPVWCTQVPDLGADTLTLSNYGTALAPFFGTLEYLDQGAEFRNAEGVPINGPVAVFRLHPQAVARLDRLFSHRFAQAGQPHHRLLPETLVFTGATPAPDRSPQSYEAGEALSQTEPMSFHDNRGLIIDPIAIAALFADLIQAFPALDASAAVPGSGNGTLATIMALETGVLVQVTDLHGRPFGAIPGGPGVEVRDDTNVVGALSGGQGLATLADGQRLAGSGDAAGVRLRLGWATGGVMNAGPLSLPGLPGGVTLPRQFLRAFATDLDWHLRGNRTDTTVRGVPADDGKMPTDLKPLVRDGVDADYLVAGPDLLALAGQILGRLDDDAGPGLVFAVSPQIDEDVGVPPEPGSQARWPAFPPPDTGNGLGTSASPLEGASAVWTSGRDLVLTLPADTLPDGTAVRVYSQKFQLIQSIGEAPSFLRGDGGAAIVSAGDPVEILVANPLGLAEGDPKPDPATLVFDLIVTPRVGNRRLFANRSLPIEPGPAAEPADAFSSPDPMALVPATVRSVAPSPLFGISRTTQAPDGSLSSPIDIVRALGSESIPRQGPRHPTMGRLESIVVTGIEDNEQLTEGLSWEGVLSGARWARETRSANLREGNPGNPAGPDTHAGGVRVTGALGYDLARHAIRRAQPILPMPGGPDSDTSPGWIVMSGGNNMNPPVPDTDSPPPTGTSSGVLLQTVAAISETPELSLLPGNHPFASDTPISLDQVIDDIADSLGVPSPSDDIDVTNGDRILNEIRREYFLANHGARDALWSLARVLSEAEELVYIETPGFARTARPGAIPEAHEIDLVALLASRMASHPNLKVIVAMPRLSDLVPAPFARRAYAQRLEAFNLLKGADPKRVVAFHPSGFPGRHPAIRSTTVIVDDVWSMTGATHFRRRGMTFDGSATIASFDRDIEAGYSRKVRDQRIALMAAKLEVSPLDADDLPVPAYQRLHRPASAFGLIRDLLDQKGLGQLSQLWHGPTDSSVLPQSDDVTDPDGTLGAPQGLTLASFLSEA